MMELFLPYVSVLAFLIGIAYKLGQWLAIPVPLPLTIFPAQHKPAKRVLQFLQELLFFKSMFSHNRLLWGMAWSMHFSLALIIAGHIVGIYYLGGQFTMLGIGEELSQKFSYFLGMASGLWFIGTLAGLLCYRLLSYEIRTITPLSSYLELGLLAGIAITGTVLRFSLSAADLGLTRDYLASLLILRPVKMPDIPLFYWHFLLSNLLIIILPYSRLLHGIGACFTRNMLIQPPPQYSGSSTAASRQYIPPVTSSSWRLPASTKSGGD